MRYGGSTDPASAGLASVLLRAWMWLVPVAILLTSAIFATVAALDGRWGLLAIMVLVGVFFGLGLLVVHWWVMYRFGSAAGQATIREGGKDEGS